MINALPKTCQWFAHKGAGYDSVAVHAAKARGEQLLLRAVLRLSHRPLQAQLDKQLSH
jgi:hypothetical protein